MKGFEVTANDGRGWTTRLYSACSYKVIEGHLYLYSGNGGTGRIVRAIAPGYWAQWASLNHITHHASTATPTRPPAPN